jgi:hypothetical protein
MSPAVILVVQSEGLTASRDDRPDQPVTAGRVRLTVGASFIATGLLKPHRLGLEACGLDAQVIVALAGSADCDRIASYAASTFARA